MPTPSRKPRSAQPPLLVAETPRVRVLLPLPLAGAYDYRVPQGMALAPGEVVAVFSSGDFVVKAGAGSILVYDYEMGDPGRLKVGARFE